MSGNRIIPKYDNELSAQIDFLQTYIPRVDKTLDKTDIQSDYSDGVINGNILEFKLIINDLNSVLFQTLKYLSAMRIKGRFIPANILLISANNSKAYLYKSADYLPYIEKIYIGAASKHNKGFTAGKCKKEINYSEMTGQNQIIEILRTKGYTRIHIDENCIVGWATTFYRLYPRASKADFIGDETGHVKIIGEIRQPDKFKEYIFPYQGRSNQKFRYLMDKLNDDLHKKDLGAFYTHPLYAEKSLELVREAIARVPNGNDYIILDRCAGTGNLEQSMTEEELSHVIVSTYEYYEYKVLVENFGDKVRSIIPPVEAPDTFNGGMVRGANALSKEYINNEIIMQYVNNPNCTIILFENPPYAETTSLEHQRRGAGKRSSTWKNEFAFIEMKKELSGAVLNDLGNVFIWSAFKYYLRQPTDSYIVYSPVKYWKAQHLVNLNFIKGFAFNRKHFHTKIDACIMCALWSNEKKSVEKIVLDGYDIINDKLGECVQVDINKVHNLYSKKYYDKRTFPNGQYDGILVGLNGLEAAATVKRRIKPLYSNEVIGYMVADSVGFDNPDAKSSLLVAGRYNGNGFFLRKDNFLEKLPMFAASRYISYNRAWTERGRIMKSADGAKIFYKDLKKGELKPFLLKCLLFTVLEPQNHIREFKGSDNRYYKNELCLDTTNGITLAVTALKEMIKNENEEKLINIWETILKNAKETKEYKPTINYGLYQIKTELDTSHKDTDNQTTIYDYPELHGNINTLAELVKKYYLKEIVPILFKYEFLK